MENKDEGSLGQRLKAVTLLQCEPGRAFHAEHGTPIAMLTVSFMDEIEEPMALCLSDAGRLASELIRILDMYGSETANEIVRNHLLPKCSGVVDWRINKIGDGSPLASRDDPRQAPGTLKLTGVHSNTPRDLERATVMHVRFKDDSIGHLKLGVSGGYKCGRRTMVLFRCSDLARNDDEAVAKLGRKQTVRFKNHQADERLDSDDLQGFKHARPRSKFRIGSTIWQKMTDQQLAQLLDNKVFFCVE